MGRCLGIKEDGDWRGTGWRLDEVYRTLQKSMALTPLLPRAGPTGGEGDA